MDWDEDNARLGEASSSGDADLRGDGTDKALAAAWLANERLYLRPDPDDRSIPDGYDIDIKGRVLELVQNGRRSASRSTARAHASRACGGRVGSCVDRA